MEKIIATEIEPKGLDSEILTYIEDNRQKLKLEESILYYGFPVFKDYEDQSVKSKIVVLSKMHGIVLLSTSSISDLEANDDNLSQVFNFIEAAIKKSKILRISKKKLAVELESYLYCSQEIDFDGDSEVLCSLKGIDEAFNEIEVESQISDEHFNEVRSILEGAKALSRPSKRTKISEDPSTKLNILISLENEISNFDIEQRKIAISLINGPQRIRGLAGSGKTVVLAMKAAHIHLQHPDKKILFTFYTKSLYGLIRELIARFYRHFAGSEPNWEMIDVYHSWGGRTIDGVCYNACLDNSIRSLTFSEARAVNSSDPFGAACHHVLSYPIKPKYDYILIDEAQDLPNDFFKICYELSMGEEAHSKNIVWGYDELQSIFNVYQRSPQELFGVNAEGEAKIDLVQLRRNLPFGQTNDLVLYKCYRNPLEVLLTAHALGFGLYSDYPVQTLENEEHWNDVGYRLEDGNELKVGERVTITRDRENSPLSIYEHQDSKQLINLFKARNLDEECEWIANNIEASVKEGLKPHDIMVICFDDYNAKSYFSKISKILSLKGIRSNNLLTASAAAPPFMLEDMVTLSTVHRAKGNEAAEVFTAGIDALFNKRNTRSGRNKIFTAFTRTKAWLKVSGISSRVDGFFAEIEESISKSPSLNFVVPDTEKIQRDHNAKPQEILKLQELVGTLMEQGYSEEQIQMELSLKPDSKQ
ncbi:DEAD/DEAH box helicase [Vibrio cyclitrophicus]|uniref:DEAD/DEAH box helicase n=1 Tax=Vibrio TaxID=662 RepID=UPI000C85976B|nr:MULTISPECIES: ATP-binding domain-containing protein [Vibrio]MBE8555183.1 ATP-binding domain-containing protein [Vibrio sp. OPT24]UPR24656.1 DEAD/DEAH box helicase [Vibrio cyclitrophicus]